MAENCYECHCCEDIKDLMRREDLVGRVGKLETFKEVEELGLSAILTRMDKHDLNEKEKRTERNADKRVNRVMIFGAATSFLSTVIMFAIWLSDLSSDSALRKQEEDTRLKAIERVLGVDEYTKGK